MSDNGYTTGIGLRTTNIPDTEGLGIALDTFASDGLGLLSNRGTIDLSSLGGDPSKGFQLPDFKTIFEGMSALSGLAEAFTAYKNYGLANKKFNYEKQAYNTNLANQTQMINNDYINRAKIGLALSGADTSNDAALTESAKRLVKDQLLPTKLL